MLVSIYKSDRDWTFENVKGSEAIRVKVPAGSELLRTKLFGLELFVPSPADRRVRMGYSPELVLAETRRPTGRFKAIHARGTVTVSRHSK
jgi:hypothetical protein